MHCLELFLWSTVAFKEKWKRLSKAVEVEIHGVLSMLKKGIGRGNITHPRL